MASGEQETSSRKDDHPVGKDLTRLNADDLDIKEIDEEAMEEAAGGAGCPMFYCGVYNPV